MTIKPASPKTDKKIKSPILPVFCKSEQHITGKRHNEDNDTANDKQPCRIDVQLHDSRKNDATENQLGDVKAVIPELLKQQVFLGLNSPVSYGQR